MVFMMHVIFATGHGGRPPRRGHRTPEEEIAARMVHDAFDRKKMRVGRIHGELIGLRTSLNNLAREHGQAKAKPKLGKTSYAKHGGFVTKTGWLGRVTRVEKVTKTGHWLKSRKISGSEADEETKKVKKLIDKGVLAHNKLVKELGTLADEIFDASIRDSQKRKKIEFSGGEIKEI